MPKKEISPVSSESLLAFLLEPRSYPHRPKRVRLVQTHASYVLLVAPYVYKVKKPVNFGFLDFSTLENRRYFSEREVILNRRLCPRIYLGVVPISSNAGRLVFGPGDEVVEYAVKMRKLQDRYFMLRLLKRDQVKAEDLDRVVSTLKIFYEAQTPTKEVTTWGQIEKLKISIEENFRQTETFIGCTVSRPALETIRLYTGNFYTRNAELFDSRTRQKRIRDCHGDLHLEHIHLAPKTLSIYDCIEFNDRFRYIDVASDVAFLAMDFDYHGRPDLSRQFTERMAAALGDRGMLHLLDFYKCYRAYVRGKVESFQQREAEMGEPERSESRTRAERYFQLALQYAVCGSEPIVVIVVGRVGSGKSTLASALGRELGWEVLSSDHTRKELAGVPLYKRGGPAARRRLYSKAMTRKTYETLLRNTTNRVKERRSLILDATFSRRHHRDRLREQFDLIGVTYCFAEAQASEQILKKRLERRGEELNEVSDARLEDLESLNQSYEAPLELEAHHLVTVSADRPLEITVAETLKALMEQQANRTTRA
jgi:aminoglycoside phosphotransferase family enzyme/predicted kinase